MKKILFWGLFTCLVVFLFKRKKAPIVQPTHSIKHQKNGHEVMVRCYSCGLHMPESDALTHNNQTYCSEAHVK